MTGDVIANRQQQVLYDKKWIKFLRRTWLFRHIPFVEFALAAGSLATGNVHEGSDFDVIVGAKYGRIFTCRFFCALAFSLFRWRRIKFHGSGQSIEADQRGLTRGTGAEDISVNPCLDQHKSASISDKVCLNHFVTEKSYRLSPPHNEYWRNLYQNLVPIFGPPEKINEFFAANSDWANQCRDIARPLVLRCPNDPRHSHCHRSWSQRIIEKLLGNSLGDWLESKLRLFQIARIEKSLGKDLGYKPRIIYSDEELEFHPDTKRTEDYG